MTIKYNQAKKTYSTARPEYPLKADVPIRYAYKYATQGDRERMGRSFRVARSAYRGKGAVHD